jgi:hypothetical protein
MNRMLMGLIVFSACRIAFAGELKQIGAVKLKGDLAEAKDISALGIMGDYLILASDETNRCQVLKSTNRGYALLPENDIELAAGNEEVDIEGIACDGNQVYAIGSHSFVRPRLKEDESVQNNRERLERINPPLARDLLARFSLDKDGKASSIERRSLRPVIEGSKLLRPFARIPGKENGVEIEGIAVKSGRLFIGFRGPVLRENYVPILTCEFDRVQAAKLVFVNLGGRGVRDLTGVRDGFLILAGPMGNGRGTYCIYSWNGHDCLPGIDKAEKESIKELCEIPHEGGAKPEGMAITVENDRYYEFLIAFDGPKNGGIKRFQLLKP